MLPLNLLPYRMRDDVQKSELRVSSVFVLVMLVMMGSMLLIFQAMQQSLADEVNVLRAEVYGASSSLVRQSNQVRTGAQVYEQIRQAYASYATSFSEMSSLVPENAVLTKLVFDGQTGQIELRAESSVADDADDLRRALEKIGRYRNVKLEMRSTAEAGVSAFSVFGQVKDLSDEVEQ